ncbi:MAG: hypothetical protein ABIJ40_14470 [Bacteroidota bacterium]
METQIITKTNSVRVKIFLNLPYRKKPLAIGYIQNQTYYLPKKSTKHLFKMYSGLGCNFELLTNTKIQFNYIQVNFNGEILRTTRSHFLETGKSSPFVSSRVDYQIILPLSEWKIPPPEMQAQRIDFNLFGEARYVF